MAQLTAEQDHEEDHCCHHDHDHDHEDSHCCHHDHDHGHEDGHCCHHDHDHGHEDGHCCHHDHDHDHGTATAATTTMITTTSMNTTTTKTACAAAATTITATTQTGVHLLGDGDSPPVYRDGNSDGPQALDSGAYGVVLRSRALSPVDGTWLHFDMVPGEIQVRRGGPDSPDGCASSAPS